MRVGQWDLGFAGGIASEGYGKTLRLFAHLDRRAEPARGFEIGLHWFCRWFSFSDLPHAFLRHRLNDIGGHTFGCLLLKVLCHNRNNPIHQPTRQIDRLLGACGIHCVQADPVFDRVITRGECLHGKGELFGGNAA